GATPLKWSATVSPRLARCTSIVPEPAMVDMNGSTTVMANAVATAASTALPPRARIAAPTAAPRGCSATTMPRAASGVCLVTTTRERIMRPPGLLRLGRVLRDVHEALAGEVEVPADGIDPHLGGVALDERPVPARELFHLALIPADGDRGPQQDHDLLLVLADSRLAEEAERGDVEGIGLVGMLAQVGPDLLLDLLVPAPLLLERRLPPVLGEDPEIEHLDRGGTLRGALLDRLLASQQRAPANRKRADQDHYPPNHGAQHSKARTL